MRLIRVAALQVAAALALTAVALAADTPAAVRPSPEFKVRFLDGTDLSISSLRGKVVALLFVNTTCPHCQHACEVFSKLYTEYGSRGFQPVAVAFDPMANLKVRDFTKDHNLNFLVGFGVPEDVLAYLNFSVMDRYVVPQIAWIDRKGSIRSQTPPLGEDKLLQEPYWRNMIETLTKEPAPAGVPHRTAAAKKTP